MSQKKIAVAVAGALGKMGAAVIEAVSADPELELVGAVDVRAGGGAKAAGIEVKKEIAAGNFTRPADVLVEFTHPKSVLANIAAALGEDMHCVVGTTGIPESEFERIDELARRKKRAVLIAPNFAVGAVLMMKFSEMAARFMKRAEIVEFHHDGKADAPSGTALLTAKLMAGKKPGAEIRRDEMITLPGARGGELSGVRIHSVRLPGLVAHQEVIFGDTGQTLTIRHDSVSRESFMPGVVFAIKAITGREGLFFGLEKFMDLGF